MFSYKLQLIDKPHIINWHDVVPPNNEHYYWGPRKCKHFFSMGAHIFCMPCLVHERYCLSNVILVYKKLYHRVPVVTLLFQRYVYIKYSIFSALCLHKKYGMFSMLCLYKNGIFAMLCLHKGWHFFNVVST